MSSDAGQVISEDSGDSEELYQDDASDTSGSSAAKNEQGSSDISESDSGSKPTTNLEERQRLNERSELPGANDGSSETAPTVPGTFSMAQALSMIRQRREQEQQAAEAKEKVMQAERLEKVRVRRRRQRRNQRLRKAQLKLEGKNLKEDSKSSPDDQQQQTPDLSTLSPNEGGQGLAGQAEAATSNELKRGHESAMEDGDAMLKRLPVKKRIKLESANHLQNQDKPVEGPRNNSDNDNKLKGPTAGCAPSSTPSEAVAVNGNPGLSQINRFIPRALLLKMGKASKKP